MPPCDIAGFFSEAKYRNKKIDKSTLAKVVECESDDSGEEGRPLKYTSKRRATKRLGDLPDVPIDLLGLYVKYVRREFKTLQSNLDGIICGQVTARKCKIVNGTQYVEVALENERQRFVLKASGVREHIVDPWE